MPHAIVVPYDLGALRRRNGAGPEALVAHGALSELRVANLTTIELDDQPGNEIAACIAIDAALADAARQATAAGDVPVVLAGNCHSCLGTLAAAQPAGIVWFDTHGDLNTPETTPTGYFDGMALATALGWSWTGLTQQIPGFAPSPEQHVLLAGGRDLDRDERRLLEQSRVRHYLPPSPDDGAASDFDAALEMAALPPRVYVHLDLDVLDPSALRANRFSAPGGVSVRWLERALEHVRARHDIAAVGVTAFDPACDAPEKAAAIVKQLLRVLLG